MAIKKIVFSELSRSGTATKYTAIGRIKFYDSDNQLINSGNASTNTKDAYVSSAFTATTPNGYDTGYVLGNALDTSSTSYWMSNTDNVRISISFNTPQESISKIEFVPTPHADRGLDSDFKIEAFDEEDNSIHVYTVTPITTLNVVQSLSTPQLKVSLNRFLFSANNKIYSLKQNDETKHETKMTSNSLPAPLVASASSTNTSGSTSLEWKAFNGTYKTDNNDSWLSATGTTNAWIQIKYGEKKKANAVRIRNRWLNDAQLATISTEHSAPKDFNILGSNDGVNFKTLREVRNEVKWGNGEERTFSLYKFGNYQYYRVHVLNTNNSINNVTGYNFISISEILFSYIEMVTELDKVDMSNFIEYGIIGEIEHFNLIHSNKRYILQDTVSEDTDGLWKKQLDKKPLSIEIK